MLPLSPSRGNKIDEAITSYIRKIQSCDWESTAERVKIRVSAATHKNRWKFPVQARLPASESLIVTSQDVVNGIREQLAEIIAAVKSVLQKTPPELASDVMDKGIVMTGGGALLRNLDQLLTQVTGVPCQVAEEPLLCVAKGTGIAVDHLDAYKRSVLWAR